MIKIKFINIYIGEEKLTNFTQAKFINAGIQNAGIQEKIGWRAFITRAHNDTRLYPCFH
jgi:hypothetical protein